MDKADGTFQKHTSGCNEAGKRQNHAQEETQYTSRFHLFRLPRLFLKGMDVLHRYPPCYILETDADASSEMHKLSGANNLILLTT